MKSIGIDITKDAINIVEVNADRSHYEITAGDYIALNPLDESNWELDLLQHLKALSQAFDFKNSLVCVGLPQAAVSTRNVEFPFTRRLDIMKGLPFELDEELPKDSDEFVVDAKTVSQNNNMTSLLAFAAPKKEVARWLELLERVGIEPDILSVEGSAFANLFENWGAGSFLSSSPETIPQPLTLRIFTRHETSLLAAFHGSQMVFVRSIPWGEKNIVLELMRVHNYPYEQAIEMISENLVLLLNTFTATQVDLKNHELLESSLAELIHMINLSMIDLRDRFNTNISSILLLGRVARISNITAFMTKYVGVPINAESFSEQVFPLRLTQRVSGIVENIPVAVGLALEGLKRPRNPAINFRQQEFAKNNEFWADTWTKWGRAITLCAIAYGAYIVYGMAREQLAMQLEVEANETLTKSASAIANLSGREASNDRIERYLRQENEKSKNSKIFEKVQDIEPAMKSVAAISSLLPDNQKNGYDVRRLDLKNSVLIIEGEADRQDTVQLLRKRLETVSANKRVETIPVSFQRSSGKTSFGFKVNMKETL